MANVSSDEYLLKLVAGTSYESTKGQVSNPVEDCWVSLANDLLAMGRAVALRNRLSTYFECVHKNSLCHSTDEWAIKLYGSFFIGDWNYDSPFTLYNGQLLQAMTTVSGLDRGRDRFDHLPKTFLSRDTIEFKIEIELVH